MFLDVEPSRFHSVSQGFCFRFYRCVCVLNTLVWDSIRFIKQREMSYEDEYGQLAICLDARNLKLKNLNLKFSVLAYSRFLSIHNPTFCLHLRHPLYIYLVPSVRNLF